MSIHNNTSNQFLTSVVYTIHSQNNTDYAKLCSALERGENWCNIIYPRDQDLVNSDWNKKRKRPTNIINNSRAVKKSRHN